MENFQHEHKAEQAAAALLVDTSEPSSIAPTLRREQDSIDDFEHLDRDNSVKEFEIKSEDDLLDKLMHQETPYGSKATPLMPTPTAPAPAPPTLSAPFHAASAATRSFLDTERDELFVEPSKIAQQHLADRFTDSESDASSDSPRRVAPVPPQSASRPHDQPPPPPAPVLAPAPVVPAPTPILIPTPAPIPIPTSVPIQTPAPVQPPVHPPTPPRTPTPEPPAPAPPARVESRAPAPAPPARTTPPAHVMEAEVIFCQMGLDAWFHPERLHPKVEALIYWRDPVRSGAALGAGLALLVALACCSVVSVLAYVSLLALVGTVGFRIYKTILQAVQKTNDGHPFKPLLEQEIALPAEKAQTLAASGVAHANAAVHELRRLFLVEDLVDSLKFAVLLWCLTYVGALFNGITLIILGYVALFTLPKAYEANKAQVDANLELARAKIDEITAKVRAIVPIGKKAESEKDK